MSEENTRQNPFQILEKILKEDPHLSYGERVIVQSIGAIGMEVINFIRAYSGETTDDPETYGNNGVQDESAGASEEVDEVAEALDDDTGDESTVRPTVSESTA